MILQVGVWHVTFLDHLVVPFQARAASGFRNIFANPLYDDQVPQAILRETQGKDSLSCSKKKNTWHPGTPNSHF